MTSQTNNQIPSPVVYPYNVEYLCVQIMSESLVMMRCFVFVFPSWRWETEEIKGRVNCDTPGVSIYSTLSSG